MPVAEDQPKSLHSPSPELRLKALCLGPVLKIGGIRFQRREKDAAKETPPSEVAAAPCRLACSLGPMWILFLSRGSRSPSVFGRPLPIPSLRTRQQESNQNHSGPDSLSPHPSSPDHTGAATGAVKNTSRIDPSNPLL